MRQQNHSIRRVSPLQKVCILVSIVFLIKVAFNIELIKTSGVWGFVPLLVQASLYPTGFMLVQAPLLKRLNRMPPPPDVKNSDNEKTE
jgi:hypothetical protein